MEDDGAIASRLDAFADRASALIAKARKAQSGDDAEALAAADELGMEYREWYGDAVKLLEGNFRERFRTEFEGTNESHRIESFLDHPRTRTVHGWFRSAESTFVRPIERQTHILREMAGTLRSPLEPESSRNQRKTRRNAIFGVVLAAVVALIVAGINLISRSESGSSADPPVAASSPTSPTESPGSDNQSLSLTNYGLLSLDGGLALAYPAGRTGQMNEAATKLVKAKTLKFEDVTEFAQREVEAGAYILNGMMLEMGLEGRDDREVTVYDIRVTPTRQPVPLEAAFVLFPKGGGETPKIVNFNMDSPSPAARGGGAEGIAGGAAPFFTMERISLAKGEKDTLSLWFAARSHASEFFVDIAYEVAGRKYLKRLDLNGQPFRVAPIACAMKREGLGLGEGYDEKLASKRYGTVVDLASGTGTKPTIQKRDPEAFATQACNTWYF